MRHWVTFMLFLGMANAYVMRTNMSVAIVAMVNHTALPVISEHVDTECGNVDPNKTAVSFSLLMEITQLYMQSAVVTHGLKQFVDYFLFLILEKYS